MVVDCIQFMQRQRAIALWREITRAINSMFYEVQSDTIPGALTRSSEIPKSPTKTEMREFARAEFERNREVHDIGHIRYLISTGKTQFDGMRRYIDEQAI